jgi:L-ascorbate metabolism protein UlaG (beta-lactamase superfamily)
MRKLDYSGSPQFRDGLFRNRLPATEVPSGTTAGMAAEMATKGRKGKPRRPVEVVTPELPARAGELAATWLGHATVLLEIEGHWVLTDPVWSDRVSPSASVGPRRNHPVPMPLEDLPALSAVLISHDHYDHLDTATIDHLVRAQDAVFVVPLGISQHLLRWGVPQHRIVELDWDQSHQLGGLTFTCTEARHFSGRSLGSNTTLWSSWVVAGERRRLFFGGDSGYTPAFQGIGDRYGPFELTVLPIGAYDTRWPDVHLDPEEAVRVHREVGGGVLLPIHWATFDLAFHEWADPVEWVVREADQHGVRLALPAPGGRFETAGELPTEPWWKASA